MTLTLELSQKLETELISEAEEHGLSINDYTLQLLLSRTKSKALPGNGAELVEYWESAGLIGTRSDIVDSQKHARQLRSQAERRKHRE